MQDIENLVYFYVPSHAHIAVVVVVVVVDFNIAWLDYD